MTWGREEELTSVGGGDDESRSGVSVSHTGTGCHLKVVALLGLEPRHTVLKTRPYISLDQGTGGSTLQPVPNLSKDSRREITIYTH